MAADPEMEELPRQSRLTLVSVTNLFHCWGEFGDSEFYDQALLSLVLSQLHGYLQVLGRFGCRWSDKAVGMCIVGTEVSITKSDRNGVFPFVRSWSSIYSPSFTKVINELAAMTPQHVPFQSSFKSKFQNQGGNIWNVKLSRHSIFPRPR